MLPLSTGFIVSNGVKMHYYRTGGAKPSLVMVHGISDDGLCWEVVANALADRYDCVMVDMRGHGKSDAPETGYNTETLARELVGFIEGLELVKPIVLGHSMGAATTLLLAAMYPNLPRAIMLEDPPAFWRQRADAPEARQLRERLINNFRIQKRMTYAELVSEAKVTRNTWSETEIENWANAKLRFSPIIEQLVHVLALGEADFPAKIRQVKCPALLIAGEPTAGAIATETDIASLRELMPHLISEKVEGAGHSIRRYNLNGYMDVVNRFLATVA